MLERTNEFWGLRHVGLLIGADSFDLSRLCMRRAAAGESDPVRVTPFRMIWVITLYDVKESL
jgi:hypothetical protein